MAKFQIGIVGMGRNNHTNCFVEFVRTLAAALRALGHECSYASEGGTGRLILLGAGNLSDDRENPKIPEDTIIYNAEQLAVRGVAEVYFQSYPNYRNHVVWDYSSANVATLKKLGITRAVHCPLGHVPSTFANHFRPAAPRALAAEKQDIDVLFYGSTGAKDGPRREILDALDDAGLKTKRLFNVYGEERDKFIARAKIVLNLHFYPNGVFEIFRVSHLLDSHKCVVTEAGGCDAELEKLASETCVYVPRDKIVDECVMLAADDGLRRALEVRGFEAYKKTDFIESVRKALEAS